MLIKNANSATSTLHDRNHMEKGYVVSFDDDDVARVKAAVGEALVESDEYPGIESAEQADDDAGAEPDEPSDDDDPPDEPVERSADGVDGGGVGDDDDVALEAPTDDE